MIYEREDLEQKNCIELHAIAEQRGLLSDFDEEDDIDEHLLIGIILDAQNEDLDAEVEECEERDAEEYCDECGGSFEGHEGLDEDEQDALDKQRAEDDRDPRINRRDGQDGSDDYC
ncbi:hypothetical protein pEaSNUABM39_00256 [Erwinia phage pEa_SNUABM_39]|nr:hypothetical protein pEaSNUABM39_00256 [Erwinia phage pEa_SNUABM_39]